MNYPNFFNDIPTIELYDPLSELLSSFVDGEYEISYLELVKASGHSCPTVAGAYLMSYHALKALYPDQRAVRGDILVSFKEDMQDGTIGLVSNLISIITGATQTSGFKGLNGNFVRHSLMSFNVDIPNIRFTRKDTAKSVDVFYDPSSIPTQPRQTELMGRIFSDKATDEEKKEFGKLWQERVKTILVDNFDKQTVIQVKETA